MNNRERPTKRTKYISFIFFLTVILTAAISTYFNRIKPEFIQLTKVPDLMLVITTCSTFGKLKLHPEMFGIPYYINKCDPKTNEFDCRESVPYLKFFIRNYDAPMARKFIFIHDHNTSWHYRVSIYRIIKNLLHTKEFYQMDFGSVNHHFIQRKVHWVVQAPYRRGFKLLYENTPIYKYLNYNKTWFPCCGTFFVKAYKFRTQTKELYHELIKRCGHYSRIEPERFKVMICAHILEFTWHLRLNDNPVFEDRNYTLIENGKIWSKAPPLFSYTNTSLDHTVIENLL